LEVDKAELTPSRLALKVKMISEMMNLRSASGRSSQRRPRGTAAANLTDCYPQRYTTSSINCRHNR
jgi:hypothetical protein